MSLQSNLTIIKSILSIYYFFQIIYFISQHTFLLQNYASSTPQRKQEPFQYKFLKFLSERYLSLHSFLAPLFSCKPKAFQFSCLKGKLLYWICKFCLLLPPERSWTIYYSFLLPSFWFLLPFRKYFRKTGFSPFFLMSLPYLYCHCFTTSLHGKYIYILNKRNSLCFSHHMSFTPTSISKALVPLIVWKLFLFRSL